MLQSMGRKESDMTERLNRTELSHLAHLPLTSPISDPSASQDSSTSKIYLGSIFCPSAWVKLLPPPY